MKDALIPLAALALIALIYFSPAIGLSVMGGIVAWRYSFWRMVEKFWRQLRD